MINITLYGAIGDGKTNCSPALKAALEKETELFFPAGIYVITEELLIPSNRHLCLDKNATIFAADNCFNKPGVRAVITNADHENGNENIIIEGGKIDANNIHNVRTHWKFSQSRGLTYCFKRVKNLTIRNMISHNADSYNFHLCRIENFFIEDITFTATHLPRCQDGVHVGSFCHHGVIRNIKAEYGCTNDDLLAFSADEIHSYKHNEGLEDGPISDILIENIAAESCWSAVRILSVFSEISNLTFRNMSVGVRKYGINMDASRHLDSPIFSNEEFPNGVGKLKNIVFENVTLWKTDRTFKENVLDKQGEIPLTVDSFPFYNAMSSGVFNLFGTLGDITIKNLVRDLQKDCNPDIPFIGFEYLHNTTVTANNETFTLQGEKKLLTDDKYDITIKSN